MVPDRAPGFDPAAPLARSFGLWRALGFALAILIAVLMPVRR